MLAIDKVNGDLERAIEKEDWAEIERILRGKRVRPDRMLSEALFDKAVSKPNPKLLVYLSAYEADRLDPELIRTELNKVFSNPQAVVIANELLKVSLKSRKWELINVLCTVEEKFEEGLIYSLFDIALTSSKYDTVETILNLRTINKLNSAELGKGLILLMRLPNPSEGYLLFRKKQIHFIIEETSTEPNIESLERALEIAAQKKDLESLQCLWDSKEKNKLRHLSAQMLQTACNKLFHYCVVCSIPFAEYQEIFSYFWKQIARNQNKPLQFSVDQTLKQAVSPLIKEYLMSLTGEMQPSEQAIGELFVTTVKNLDSDKSLSFALTLFNEHKLDPEASSKALGVLINKLYSDLSWQMIQSICKMEGPNRPTEEAIGTLLKSLFKQDVEKAMGLCEQLQRQYPATINEAIKGHFIHSDSDNSQLKSYVQKEQWGFVALLLKIDKPIEESTFKMMYDAAHEKNPEFIKNEPKLLRFEQQIPEKKLARQREIDQIP